MCTHLLFRGSRPTDRARTGVQRHRWDCACTRRNDTPSAVFFPPPRTPPRNTNSGPPPPAAAQQAQGEMGAGLRAASVRAVIACWALACIPSRRAASRGFETPPLSLGPRSLCSGPWPLRCPAGGFPRGAPAGPAYSRPASQRRPPSHPRRLCPHRLDPLSVPIIGRWLRGEHIYRRHLGGVTNLVEEEGRASWGWWRAAR